MDPEEIESRLRRFFEADPHGALAVYLFGSVARRRARKESDVDIGALFESAPPRTMEGMPFALEAELEALLGKRVQVVALNRAPPDLVHRVIRDGRIVLDRDRARRLEFEVKVWKEFFDLEPYLKQYRDRAIRAR